MKVLGSLALGRICKSALKYGNAFMSETTLVVPFHTY
jgi:hypothetical protein